MASSKRSAHPDGNLFERVPRRLPEELVDILVQRPAVRVERIVSRGHASAPGFWYDQAEHEWVVVIAGRARLELEGSGEIELGPGDHLNLPAHRRHRVVWTDPDCDTIWLAVFYR